MLEARTDENRDRVKNILGCTSVWFCDASDGLYIDDFISYDEMAKIVDYLKSVQNKP